MHAYIFQIIIVLLVFTTEAQSSLLDAVRSGNVAEVRTELANGANIDQQDPNTGETALHIAAAAGNQEIVELLLNPPREPRAWGQTLVGLGSVLGAAGLFAMGYHTNLPDSVGPVIEPHVMGTLLLAGIASLFQGWPPNSANASLRNNEGNTALELALENRHISDAHTIANALRRARREPIMPYPHDAEYVLVDLINSDFTQLQTLDLRHFSLTPDCHRRIVSAISSRRRPYLTHLVLDASHWREEANQNLDALFIAIQQNFIPNLTALTLVNNELITRLDFYQVPMSTQTQQILRQLLADNQLSHLEHLELGDNALNLDTVQSLIQAINSNRLSNLVHLGVGNIGLNHEEDRLSQSLLNEHLPHLVSLNLEHANLSQGTEEQLLQGITHGRLPALSSLLLANDRLGTRAELERESAAGHVQLAYIIGNALRANAELINYPSDETDALVELINWDLPELQLVDLRQIDLQPSEHERVLAAIAAASRLSITQILLDAAHWRENANHNIETLFNAIMGDLLPNLTELRLVNTHTVTHLDFHNRPLNDQAQRILRQLITTEGSLINLEHLELGNTNMSRQTVASLGGAIRNNQLPNLVYLGLAGLTLDHRVQDGLFQVLLKKTLPRLASLNLENTNLNSEAWQRLFLGITNGVLPSLTSITLANNPITQLDLRTIIDERAWRILAQTIERGQLANLTILDLGNNNLGPDAGRILTQAIADGQLANLTQLGLFANNLGPEAGLILAQAIADGQLANLTILDLANNNLGPDTGRILANAIAGGRLANLTQLGLFANNLGPEAGLILAQAIADGQLANLTILDLGNNNLGPEAGQILAQAIKDGRLANLTILYLANNNLEPVAPSAWFGLVRNNRGPQAGRILAQAIANGRLPNLTYLSLRNNNLSQEDKDAIRRLIGDRINLQI